MSEQTRRPFDWDSKASESVVAPTEQPPTPVPQAPPEPVPVETVQQPPEPVAPPTETIQPTTTYSTDYKERMSQVKANSAKAITDAKEKVIADIKGGAGDSVAVGIRNLLHKILMAPHEVLNYTIISVMSTSDRSRTKFVLIGCAVSIVCAINFLVIWILTKNIKYLIDVVGCLVALVVMLLFKDLTLTSSVNLGELQEQEDMYL